MLFTSWSFVILVLLTALVYYLPFLKKRQVAILLISSFVFYAYQDFWLLLLLLLSAFLNGLASYNVLKDRNAKTWALGGVILNLCLLLFFKYSGFLYKSFAPSDDLSTFWLTLPLPLGISFYTFSGISLLVDVFRGNREKTITVPTFYEHIKRTVLYIVFFPKLLAGPIMKSEDFFKEIGEMKFKDINIQYIFKSLCVGYFLKMVIADNLADFTNMMSAPYFEYQGSGDLLLMLFGYSMQIFADFAGYSLIAIGVAAVFGYYLPTNFNFPYISSSFRDFWKRWHITLSQFLMNYLYISLGGNRKGKARTYLNLLLTMMLGGLWHGAAWSFIVWGTFHGLCLAVERALCGRRDDVIMIGISNGWKRFSHIISILFVFGCVTLGWLLFRLQNFGEAVSYLNCIWSNYGKIAFISPSMLPIVVYSIPVLLYHLFYKKRNTSFVQKYVLNYNYVWYGFMLFLILTNSGSGNAFVYFQF